jgi:hypothetical protein
MRPHGETPRSTPFLAPAGNREGRGSTEHMLAQAKHLQCEGGSSTQRPMWNPAFTWKETDAVGLLLGFLLGFLSSIFPLLPRPLLCPSVSPSRTDTHATPQAISHPLLLAPSFLCLSERISARVFQRGAVRCHVSQCGSANPQQLSLNAII